ncbi:CTD small phosphatase-like protein 2-B isoform X2 [Cuculus canorus]|uniref:CTD small phosphatase-like protein 2-B isoform X2 n=1 Tax=Cuculus canorus TaxID=55661 RepID=UPI0023AA3AA9|nr:CTD small phosphatase-like protein 2-B isoform X2 [Cuculus canorus]XP_053906352.1 CTD small phosphatase-like protein 2-B isoform X2 [Cuculus canorus]
MYSSSWRPFPRPTRYLKSSCSPKIFIFTTAKQDYAEKVWDVLDSKKKLIRLVKPCWGPLLCWRLVPMGSASPSRHCLSQQHCLCARGYYWKDLTCLGRDLAKTVALDHTIQGFSTQAANWIPVPRWWGDPQDEELLRLTPLLGQLSWLDDVRTEIQHRFPHLKLPTED